MVQWLLKKPIAVAVFGEAIGKRVFGRWTGNKPNLTSTSHLYDSMKRSVEKLNLDFHNCTVRISTACEAHNYHRQWGNNESKPLFKNPISFMLNMNRFIESFFLKYEKYVNSNSLVFKKPFKLTPIICEYLWWKVSKTLDDQRFQPDTSSDWAHWEKKISLVTFNASKTKLIMCHRPRTDPELSTITMNGYSLREVPYFETL